MEDTVEELSQRGEIFRSKLIEDFQLLDSLNSKGNIESPRFYSNEIQDPVIMDKLLKESPHSLVKFQVYSKREEIKFSDRRLNRVRNKSRIPFGPWAHYVTESSTVQNFIMFLIIANSIVLGVQAEIADKEGPTIAWVKVMLNVFDYITLIVFVMEIIIKWIDGFWIFWKNGWNNFDFFVTAMSVIPEIFNLFSGRSSSQIAIVGENMRVFKILRSLKMVSRFAQLRIIVLTIFKAFKSMAFILILLTLFMYIFAVAGTIVFDSYAKSERKDLKYKNSFSTLKNAFITLFQLFTLDHWYEILNDMIKAVNPSIAKVYVLLWICIGAFIFRNIFVGIMADNLMKYKMKHTPNIIISCTQDLRKHQDKVNNFQNIRNDFNQQIKEQIAVKERADVRTQLTEELDKLDKKHRQSRRTSSLAASAEQLSGKRKSSLLHKVFRRTAITTVGVASEEPIEEGPEEQVQQQEVPQQPQFVTHLQEKIAQIRSKETSLKPQSSFHAYYGSKLDDSSTTEDIEDPRKVREADTEPPSLVEQDPKKVLFKENSDKKENHRKLGEGEDPKTTELNSEEEFSDWEKTVQANLHNFQRFPMETLWPRDTLFKYFQLMESLQENLVERKQLMRLLVESLLQFHDSKEKPT